MQKRKHALFIFLFIGFAFGFSQLDVNGESNVELISKFKSLPQERVFLHFNTNILFTGERFFYSVYCQDAKADNFSELSQVAYIELVSENGTSVAKQKVRLDRGRGYGDFFISEEQRTGSYKLLAYTNWMKNFGTSSFFKADLVIINPYQKVPEKHRVAEGDSTAQLPISGTNPPPVGNQGIADRIQLELDNQVIGKRKPVTLRFQNKDSNVLDGSYSLSISKRSELFSNWGEDIIGGTKNNSNPISSSGTSFWAKVTSNETFYLPELRGELISGRIVNSNTDLPASGYTVALSIPGEDYLLKTATTNKEGQFFMNVNEDYGNTTAVVNNLSGNWENVKFLLDEKVIAYDQLNFKPFMLDPSMATRIQERSVQNQIANAYGYLRNDDALEQDSGNPFYRQLTRTFNLDDFTRFKTLKETFVEVINQVGIRRNRDGKRVFQVFTDFTREKSGLQPMLFVDGVFISEHENFMDYDARKIQEIGYSKGLYRLGPISFDGILVIKTIDGNLNETFYADNQLKTNLQSAEEKKKYFKQVYGAGDSAFWTRIPDFRRQLLWIPDMQIVEETPIEFYTSNIEGVYDVILKGFDGNGKPVTATTSFTVE